jgi:hypothetical protein
MSVELVCRHATGSAMKASMNSENLKLLGRLAPRKLLRSIFLPFSLKVSPPP